MNPSAHVRGEYHMKPSRAYSRSVPPLDGTISGVSVHI
jgi:hypothetical protein